jgi:CRP/FNR family transcriptional regulator
MFDGVSNSDLNALAAQCEWLELARHQPLFLQDDPADQLYLVVEGLIKVYRLDPRGERQIVLHLDRPGQCVAAVAAFMSQPRYPACAEAAEPSLVLAIPARELNQLAQRNLRLSGNLLRYAAERVGQIVQVLDRMVFHEVDSRLAEYLLSMAQTHGQGFKLPTNPEIAAIIGTTPEPVSRKLGHFSQQGWVRICKRKLCVLNIRALAGLAQTLTVQQALEMSRAVFCERGCTDASCQLPNGSVKRGLRSEMDGTTFDLRHRLLAQKDV